MILFIYIYIYGLDDVHIYIETKQKTSHQHIFNNAYHITIVKVCILQTRAFLCYFDSLKKKILYQMRDVRAIAFSEF